MADAERQLAVEGAQRLRVAAAAVVAGLFFFGGQLWVTAIGAKEQTIGVLQGLAPAFSGLRAATIDPRTVHEQFLVHHQSSLIAAFVISNLGTLAMILPLRYLAAAERARSPAPSVLVGHLALYGPILLAIFLPAFEISLILGAHSYLSHSARDAAAITAATAGGVRVAFQLILTLGTLAVAGAFIMVSLRSMRVGLLTRMMGIVGIISGVLFLIPLTPLPVVQALWLVFFGAMLLGFGGARCRRHGPPARRVRGPASSPPRVPRASRPAGCAAAPRQARRSPRRPRRAAPPLRRRRSASAAAEHRRTRHERSQTFERPAPTISPIGQACGYAHKRVEQACQGRR